MGHVYTPFKYFVETEPGIDDTNADDVFLLICLIKSVVESVFTATRSINVASLSVKSATIH